MPRCEPAVPNTGKLALTGPAAGIETIAVGGAISGGVTVDAPNTLISIACEFCNPPHLQVRGAYSPQFAGSLRKNFWPPQSVRYVIGSLHADDMSTNEYS